MRPPAAHLLNNTFRISRKKLFGIVLLVSFLLPCALPAVSFAKDIVRIGGVGSALGTMQKVAQAFELAHPGIKIRILPSLGSTGGIRAVLDGALDIGLSSRTLKEDEQAKGAVAFAYAKTAFVVVTHASNTVSGLSTRELIEIYEGTKQAWPDGKRIRIVTRPESDIDIAILKNISREMSLAVQKALSRKGMIIAVTNQESDENVERVPGSLGTSTLAQVISEGRSLKMLMFNGIYPSLTALSDGRYALVKPFYIVTTSKTSGPVQQFILFLRSSTGRKVLSANGNIVLEDKPTD